ncbi:MAG: hypothetical protein F6J92_20195 [Symploca sp. SIO1A3]|nr:hypothetical protein [Symploca sp. SIO1A3]
MATSFQNRNQVTPLQVEFTLAVNDIPKSVQEIALARAKETYVMALLEAGEISSGKAASLLGIPRIKVIESMGKWGISLFDDSLELEDLAREIEQANTSLNKSSV